NMAARGERDVTADFRDRAANAAPLGGGETQSLPTTKINAERAETAEATRPCVFSGLCVRRRALRRASMACDQLHWSSRAAELAGDVTDGAGLEPRDGCVPGRVQRHAAIDQETRQRVRRVAGRFLQAGM